MTGQKWTCKRDVCAIAGSSGGGGPLRALHTRSLNIKVPGKRLEGLSSRSCSTNPLDRLY